MNMCKFAGCLGAATKEDMCPIHWARAGVPCERCKGAGAYWYTGEKVTMACQFCGGSGLKDKSKAKAKAVRTPVDERGLIQAQDGAEDEKGYGHGV
jgi:DnaJ-class molecular chaperone